MRISYKFLFFVVITAVVTVLGNLAVLYPFSSGAIPFGTMVARFALAALVYVIAVSMVLGLKAPLFSSRDFNAESEKFFSLLKKIGAVPIKSIAMIVLLQVAFLWVVIFVLGESFGVLSETRSFLYSACLAAGMAMGTFVYVISDGFVSRALLAHNITSYPRELREDRQSLKACIIPVAVAILSVMFTFSTLALSLAKAGVDLGAIGRGGWGIAMLAIAAFFTFVIVLAIVLKRNTATLFHTIVAQLENLSSGKRDLRRRVHVASVDELGSIAGMMNTFCENIDQGMIEIQDDEQELSVSSEQLEVNAQGMNSAVERISAASALMREKAGAQMSSVDKASAAIHKIANNIDALNNSINVQSDSVSLASSSVEEMVGNIVSIGNVTEKMAEHFNTVNKAANEGLSIEKESTGRVQQIVEQSKTLQAANRIITTISSQTNLLAMNAAIEAAHAGEAGRGFSVVADEIRKLAETASVESKKINNELKQIAKTIDGIVRGAELSAAAFSAVSTRVNETQSLVFEVNSAIKEQQQGAEQILGALKRMNEITAEVKIDSSAMQEGNDTMLNEIGSLQDQSKDITLGMENINLEMRAINTGAEEVFKLAGDTHAAVEKIKKVVDGFEV